jgi:hypothetical protein
MLCDVSYKIETCANDKMEDGGLEELVMNEGLT